MIFRRGFKITLIGLAIGSRAASAAARLLTKFLFGVKAADPGAFIGVTPLLAMAAPAARYIPARDEA
jgi:putative ABC transport system permease protein